MNHEADELRRRIDALARRVERLEFLTLDAAEAAIDVPTPPSAPTPTSTSTPVEPEPPKADDRPAEKRKQLDQFVYRHDTHLDDEAAAPASESAPPSDWMVPPKQPARRSLNLEQFVGARLFAVVGALVVVVGAVLILKVAWDAGWFGVLSDGGKCVVGAVFGLALLGAGEVARRRISDFASIGCSAAGIGVLYASAFAAYGRFELVSHEVGFALLVAVAALGVLVGVLSRLASISALSIVAGYFVPLFFLDVEPSPVVLPVYLSSLLAIGLLLSAMLGGRFTGLRTLVWWGTVLYGSAWATVGDGVSHLGIALAFFAFVWAAIHAELIFSVARRGITGEDRPAEALNSWREVRPIASSFSVSAWATLFASLALFDQTRESWAAPAMLCLVTGALAVIIGRGLSVVRSAPEHDLDRLARVFAIQCGALLIAAVALGLAGWLEVVAWMSLGVGAVVAGRTLRARPLDVYGLVVLTVVTVRLAIVDRWLFATGPDDVVWMGLYLSRWTLLVVIDGACWLLAGGLLIRGAAGVMEWRSIGRACIGVGITLVFASALHERTTDLASVLLVAAIAAVTLGVSVALRSSGLRVYSMVAPGLVASLALVKYGLDSDAGARLFGTGASTAIVLTSFSPVIFAMFVYWIAAALVSVRDRDWEGWDAVAQCCVGAGMGLLFLTFAHPDSLIDAVALVWLGLAVAVYQAYRVAPALWPRRWAIVGASASVGAWFMAYVAPSAGWSANGAALLMHPGLWMAVAIAAVLLVMSVRIFRAEPAPWSGQVFGQVGAVLATALVFLATTLEVGRVAEMMTDQEVSRRAAISIWWGVFAIGLIGLGFWRRIPIVRHTGLALLAVATAKAVIFDLAEVSTVWRAVSFLALGLMMLAVGLVYAKVSAGVGGETQEQVE